MALLGTGGTVTVGATALQVENWSCTLSCEGQDISDTSSNWTTRLAGMLSAEVKASFWWKTSTPQSVTIVTGATVTITLLIGNSSNTITGSYLVTSVEFENPAKSPVKFSITAQSSGAVTLT